MRFRKIRILARKIKDSFYWRTSDVQKERILKKWYQKKCGKKLNLNNPQTFNEKIQWLKLYDSTEEKTLLADKYLVREYVGKRIGNDCLIPLLGVWDSFDQIDFEKLPDQFVLKTNHGSGWNSIIKDKSKMNPAREKEKFDHWIRLNFATQFGYELHYMNIPPKIIAEQYMADFDGTIYDYRFFCFNGVPQFVWVDCGSGTDHHTRSIFDCQWKLQDYLVNYPPITPAPDKPDTFEKMREYAEILSQNFVFVRVDFYSIKGKIYFGEMTFTPQSGTGNWDDEKQNLKYGSLITLPRKKKIPKFLL